MKKIPISKGLFALVDDADYKFLSQFNWCIIGKGYAGGKCGGTKIKQMHRVIMGVDDPSVQVDHINGRKLDNQRRNLRIANNQQNQQNIGIKSNNKSGYKGVCFDAKSKRNPWRATIYVQKERIHLGFFSSKDDAARAYNIAARKYFGEFARVNVVRSEP